MKAILKATSEADSLEVREVPVPKVGPGEVLIQIKATGICYTDISILKNRYNGRKPVPIPLIMGHEGAGIVAELGPGVNHVSVGDRVGLEALWGCGKCLQCFKGFKNMCVDWNHIGITCDGTFAEYISLPGELAHKLPDNVSFIDAAFLEPISLVVRSLEHSKPFVGETVVILGPGSLGLMHLQAYKAAGASKVIMIGTNKDEKRLKTAESLGAAAVINSEKQDPVKEVMEITDGQGADIVVETASSPEVYKMITELAAPRGRIVLFGLYPEAVISPLQVLRKGLSIFGDVALVPRQFQRAINWVSTGKVLVEPIISRTFKLEEAKDAFDAHYRGEEVKVVFTV